ncbi:MAG: winged helix-turn-helix transcriptional regulator [Vannielia sp.]|uniref:ArsR/SmtB family transcription factor n=1 Tax=Vannielia sp. TaxID=2813045 RepID=UPI003B8C6DA2
MVERLDSTLSETLKALSDPTRRQILTLLTREGTMRVGDLAGYFEMSLNAVSKHIKVLEAAGLVTRTTQWREHFLTANLKPIAALDGWLKELRWVWDERLEALDRFLTQNPEPEETQDD